jgi:peptidoglycan hydrolase CwlO-like protein
VRAHPLELRVSRLENDVTSIYEILTDIQAGQRRTDKRITELDKRLTGRITELDQRLTGRMDTLDGKLDQVLDLLRK